MGHNEEWAGRRLLDEVPRGGWFWAENELLDLPVSMAAKIAYIALRRFSARDSTAFPSTQTLAAKMSCSQRQAYRAIEELVAVGAVDKRRGPVGSVNLYAIMSVRSLLATSATQSDGLTDRPVSATQSDGASAVQSDTSASQAVTVGLAGSRTSATQADKQDVGEQDLKNKTARRPPPVPMKPVMEHYERRFLERMGEKPHVAPPDAIQLAGLLRRYGPARVLRLIDQWFESADPWYAQAGYMLRTLPNAMNRLIAEQANGHARPDPKVVRAAASAAIAAKNVIEERGL